MNKKHLLIIVLLVFLLMIAVAAAIVWPDRPPRTNYQAELFEGVTYERQVRSTPRRLVIHIVEIDLSNQDIDFQVTPGDKSSGMDLYARTTGAFLEEFDVQLAINGGFFEPFRASTPWGYKPKSGDPVNVKGFAIANGETYSNDYVDYPVICLSADRAELQPGMCPPGTTQALAGTPILINNGTAVAHEQNPYHIEPHPRTAVAVDTGGHKLWLVIIDGRQPRYSKGATLTELTEILLAVGATDALNLDGGGSSTLVIEGLEGPQLLNAPIHTRIPMRERPVANHLGVYAHPVE